MSTLSFDSAVHEVLIQMFVAFGQGAGTMPVAAEAIAAATQDYTGLIGSRADEWRAIPFQLQTLEAARALGRLAAHLALHNGRDTILRDDYLEARRIIRPLIDCPFCRPKVSA